MTNGTTITLEGRINSNMCEKYLEVHNGRLAVDVIFSKNISDKDFQVKYNNKYFIIRKSNFGHSVWYNGHKLGINVSVK